MESRDSSSLSTTNEYCVISSAAVLAKDATFLFKSQKFTECFDVLDQISQKQQHDLKVLHNSAITEYLRDGCLDPHKLLEALNNVRQRSQKITQASSEKLEDVPDPGNKIVSNVKGINFTEPPQVSFGGSSIIYRDECDSFVAILNMATVWFHLHEYRKALSFLEPLFQNIEPIDEKTALHICLLLLDVTLACDDAHKAAEVIIYMEKAFGITAPQPTATDIIPPPPHPQPQQPSLQIPKPAPPDSDPGPDPTPIPDRDDSLSYDTLLSTLDSVIGSGPGGDHSGRVAPATGPDLANKRAIPLADLRLKIHLYRVRLLLLTKNLKAAKREVKLTMNTARGGGDSSAALILKSQLEYSRGNYRKAVRLLLASGGGAGDPDTDIVLNNNLGCIYYQLGKPHSCSVFFSRSLLLISSSQKNPKKKPVFSEDKSRHLLYNCGIQYLARGKPRPAAACFYKAASLFSDRPLFWLRMAECCLMAEGSRPRSGPVRVLGRGVSRQVALVGDREPTRTDRFPDLSMGSARECLLNALHLLRRKLEKRAPISGDMVLQISISEHESYRRSEEARMERAVLADLSYVELELGNPLTALRYADLLLNLPDRSKTYDFLGRVYAAEALCLLNRHEEAGERLRVYLTEQEDGVRVPFTEQERGSGSEEVAAVGPEEARGILYVDLAILFAARGDAERAGGLISKAPEVVLRRYEAEVMVVGVYVDLMMEKKQEALRKLRSGKRVVFLPQSGVL